MDKKTNSHPPHWTDNRVSRRFLFETTGLAVLGAVTLPLLQSCFTQAFAAKEGIRTYIFRGDQELLGKGRFWLRVDRTPKALNQEKIDLLNEVIDLIVPEDEQPGAKSVGVVYFIDQQLADSQPAERNRFLHGVERIESSSEKLFRRKFIDLETEERIRLLQSMEANKIPYPVGDGYSSTEFFTNLKVMTLKGYYSCPQVWEYLKYPGPSMWIGYPEVLNKTYEI